MKFFISYAAEDRLVASKLADALRAEGMDVWMDVTELSPGDNLYETLLQGLEESDYIVAVLSPHYRESSWVMREYEVFAARELSEGRTSILPVLIADTEIPSFLRDRVYADFRSSFEAGFRHLLSTVRGVGPDRTPEEASRLAREGRETTIDLQVRGIREQYAAGRLCLFCGAGVSAEAGLPTWAELLRTLLGSLFRRQLPDSHDSEQLAELYQEYFDPSPLMVAQYLKNGLGDDFFGRVRDSLYVCRTHSSDLIDAIVDLCRPQRSRRALRSIITFNFDDLVEESLCENRIRFTSVYAEGQRPSPEELPVYHVHGFLPREGELTEAHKVVFAEDAYHDQFLEPFSWSNLTQLNHLSQYMCLLVGLSLTDPNLRRLLDVSMRKNPDRTLNHYIFRRAYDSSTVAQELRNEGLGDVREERIHNFVRGAELLEEQDARNLGLNVIWVADYAEIPAILRRIADG